MQRDHSWGNLKSYEYEPSTRNKTEWLTHVGVCAEVLEQRRQNDVDGRLVRVLASVPHVDEQSQLFVLTNLEDVLASLFTLHTTPNINSSR